MKTMTVGEFKTRFSEALEAVRQGETVAVSYGRGRRNVAALVPYSIVARQSKRPLGLLKGKGSVEFAEDFALDDEALLNA